ncbi:MAG: ornithine carbamoyltransferase [Actinobacteria bacterium]|nr:ornithine carbamoyltransferase [Actinomycetota bacterium]
MSVDFVNVADLGSAGLAEVLDLAAAVKADRAAVAGIRPGVNVGLFFEKPSLRTRVSCEVAVNDLGMIPYVLKNDEIGLGKREAVKDVGAVLDRYLDILALRVFEHRNLETIAAHAAAPVINLLSDREHPCQALADLQTLAEARPLEGATVAFIGDGNNVCNSLMIAGAMMGVSTRVAGPAGYAPPDDMVAAARAAAGDRAEIVITEDPAEAVRGADAVYTDVWASMGQETEAAARRAMFEPYRVDEALFGLAAPDAIFLHCLPAHRGDELTDGVADHQRSRIYDQAENRMHAFKALLLHLT